MKTSSSVCLLTLALAAGFTGTAFAAPQDEGMHSTMHHVGTAVSNAAITAQVKASLLADGRTKAFDINVDTDGQGQVTLSGTAPSLDSREAAGEVAKNVNGVTSVRNVLTVAADRTDNPQTLSAKAQVVGEEGLITTKVKAALADDDRVSAMDVTVESQGSAVMLSGSVPNETARQAAIERARQVEGVTSVDATGLVVSDQP